MTQKSDTIPGTPIHDDVHEEITPLDLKAHIAQGNERVATPEPVANKAVEAILAQGPKEVAKPKHKTLAEYVSKSKDLGRTPGY